MVVVVVGTKDGGELVRSTRLGASRVCCAMDGVYRF